MDSISSARKWEREGRRSELEWASTTTSTRSSEPVPASCAAFCLWLGVTLSPGQSSIVRAVYDREPLDALTVEERELLRRMAPGLFAGAVPEESWGVVVIVAGGRGGKSYVLCGLRMLHGALTRDLSSLAPGQRAVAPIVAPNDDLRQEVVNYALGAMRSRPELAAMLRLPKGTKDDHTPQEFIIARPDGHRVLFTGAVATKGGYGGRGRSLTDAGLEECAFFRDKSAVVNDADIFGAMSPRVLPGGQTIASTTPWAKAGLAYDLHARNHAHPVDAISIHAPTLTLRDVPLTRALVARETARDPDNARREFGAEFPSSGTTQFFDVDLIESCLVDAVPPVAPGDEYAAGADMGLRSDSAALVMSRRRGTMVYVEDPLELRPRPGAPLKPGETVDTFAQAIAGRCTYVMADGYYGESIDEHPALTRAPAPSDVSAPYVRLRTLMRDQRVKLVRNARMVQQLREVTSRPLPGGRVSMVHPRWRTGGHGDIVAALVLATWQHGGDPVPEPAPEQGTAEFEAAEFERRRQAQLSARENKQPWRR